MATYRIWDEGSETEIEAENMEKAKEEAEAWLEDGEWDRGNETSYVHANVAEVNDGGDVIYQERVTVAIDPDEPDCAEGHTHTWRATIEVVGGIEENPGVWGHGGGVVIREVCVHCGCLRETDTWAQDMGTGEQGLQSVSYETDGALERLSQIQPKG